MEQIERENAGIIVIENDDDSKEADESYNTIEPREPQEIPMPELTPGSEALVAFLHSAGTVSQGGMGMVGLSWQEIESWVRCTDNIGIVEPKDLKAIYRMSREYASEYHSAGKKGAVQPWIPEVVLEEETRARVDAKAEDIFSAMMAAQSKR